MNTRNLSFEAIMDMSPDELSKLSESQVRKAESDYANDNTDDDEEDHQDDQHDNDDDQSDDEDSHTEDEHGEDDSDDVDSEDDDNEEDQGQSDDEDQDDSQSDSQDDEQSDNDDQDNSDAEPEKEAENETKKADEGIDAKQAETHKAFYEQVTATFKANGREFTITDPADVISLMQKGLNYNQKMAGIKPFYALIEVLKEHGLTDAASIGYLVDLKNKKPEAIAKLVQDSKIDTYDLNEEKANAYVPTQIDMSPQRQEIAAIEQEFGDDADFSSVLTDVTTWDVNARAALQENPALIRMLIDHKKKGIYDQVMAKVQHDIAMGQPVTNILSYYDNTGRAMFAAAQQNQGEAQAQQQAIQQQQHREPPVVKQIKQKQEKLEAAKKAASMTRTTRKQAAESKPKYTEDDIFNMSAEELAKVNPKYL